MNVNLQQMDLQARDPSSEKSASFFACRGWAGFRLRRRVSVVIFFVSAHCVAPVEASAEAQRLDAAAADIQASLKFGDEAFRYDIDHMVEIETAATVGDRSSRVLEDHARQVEGDNENFGWLVGPMLPKTHSDPLPTRPPSLYGGSAMASKSLLSWAKQCKCVDILAGRIPLPQTQLEYRCVEHCAAERASPFQQIAETLLHWWRVEDERNATHFLREEV
jgi:hypothetical protein